MRQFSTKQLVYAAAAAALAVAASMIKVFSLPMGGNVTLFSMLFVVLIGYWYGPVMGILTGAVYGMLQFVMEPYIFTIPQVILDYPLAFGALGVSGFFRRFKNGLAAGYIAGVAGRCFFAFLSGWIFFGAYAADYGMSALLYSFVYNASYLGAEAAVTLLAMHLPPVKKALLYIKETAS